MQSGRPLTRRRFLKNAAGAVGAGIAAPYFVPASALGKDGRPAPSDRITMGSIGIGGQGDRDMRTFLGMRDVQIVALCDVDRGSTRYEENWLRGVAPAMDAVTQHYAAQKASGEYKGCAAYEDFRELLARDDIDAVHIATPDHWHCVMVAEAAKAGKDIYCQKPFSLTIADGRAATDAVARYGRIFQCGSQRRSSSECRFSCELVRNGRIGKLHTVKVGLPGGYWNRRANGPTNDIEPAPEGFNYDLWLGPAPLAPYNLHRCHFTFRWNLDYSGGNITDWGAHYIDMAHWGMDAELTGPVEIEGRGEFPNPGNLWNAATSYHFEATYANGVRMIGGSDLGFGGVIFEGTDGWVELDGDTNPPSLAGSVIGADEVHLYESRDQHGNFIECVKSRMRPSTPAEIAHRSISVAHLGNIAMKLGRKLKWDPEGETFPEDTEANRLLSRPKRSPWHL
ncbi:MAG TPA: Gfo/Idh/MocA family oxidoreductase [Candidatus Brocadiia bacterium]|nr:Gfo/Idh/MocA family oxidoreductase [Candidatus Brocadiia bacterium]